MSLPQEPTDGDRERLHKEISAELFEHRSMIRWEISKSGFIGHDLDQIEVDTQVRIYKARLKPGFVYTCGIPWPFMKQAVDFTIKDFIRRRASDKARNNEVPVDELPESGSGPGRRRPPYGLTPPRNAIQLPRWKNLSYMRPSRSSSPVTFLKKNGKFTS